MVLCKKSNIFFCNETGEGVGTGRKVKQAAPAGFLYPILRISVAVEDDSPVSPDHLL